MLKRLWVAALLLIPAAWPALAQQNPSFYLVNRYSSAINELYATPAGLANWGRDRLGDNTIPPGTNYAVRLPADGNCIYDIRVVYANGQVDERRGLNTCTVDNVTFSTGRPNTSNGGNQQRQQSNSDDPSFRLVNRGRSDVNEVYASLAGVDSWGRDRLGDDTIRAGSTRVIRLPSGQCVYDVRVVFANGEATERRRVNLCNITELRVP